MRRDRVECREPSAGGRSRRARAATVALLGATLAGGALAGCSGVPGVAGGSDVAIGQTIMEMGEAVNALQAETAQLQWQVDSLGMIVARQDTVIRQLAGLAGVPVPVR